MTFSMLIFGILTVLSAAGVVFSHKALNSALCMVLTFFLIAVHYALVGADFIAALQVLVYAGAIMVLVVFVIMLLGLNEKATKKRIGLTVVLSCTTVAVFLGILFYALKFPEVFPLVAKVTPDSAVAYSGSPEVIGQVLFSKFLYPFEIVSLLLLAAIIAAVVIAYEPKRPLPMGRGLKAKQTN